MRKILLVFRDKIFFQKIKRTFPGTARLTHKTECSVQDYTGCRAAGPDLVILDWRYIGHLRGLSAVSKVVVAADSYDTNREYLSARLGAKGFITKNMSGPSLRRVVDVLSSGQVWMTRRVASRICKEYSRLCRNENNMS
ncbi:MAG: hypothetical protein AB1442_06675 [Nitrospirota bacterium]